MELGKKQMLTVVKVVDFGVYLGDDREKGSSSEEARFRRNRTGQIRLRCF